MKIKTNFALRQVADTWCVLPLAEETLNLNGMLTLNEVGAFLWSALEKGCTEDELAEMLVAEYDVERGQALADIKEFLEKLQQIGCIEE